MSDATPILSVRNVSKHFGAVQALHKVSFDIFPGELVALAGVFGYEDGDIRSTASGSPSPRPRKPAGTA